MKEVKFTLSSNFLENININSQNKEKTREGDQNKQGCQEAGEVLQTAADMEGQELERLKSPAPRSKELVTDSGYQGNTIQGLNILPFFQNLSKLP